MTFETAQNVRVVIPEAALSVIFDECDVFDQDETGGRVIGTFSEQGGRLTVQVSGIIESGPRARRSPVSFFQDGEYQESIFREIEQRHGEIEHLGNWHTHHVNRHPTLSGGDVETYTRTVNHPNHNTSFFYALLVTAKHRTSDPRRRYSVKHYLFRRGDDRLYEIPARHVEIVDAPLVWPPPKQQSDHSDGLSESSLGARPERVYDRDIISEHYPGFRSFASKRLGLYWRGALELLDGSSVEVVILEDSGARIPTYSVALRDCPENLKAIAEELSREEFHSARAALITTERGCNRALFRQLSHAGPTHGEHQG